MIKFAGDLRQVGGFLAVSSTNNTDPRDISEILLKMALSTIDPNSIKFKLIIFSKIIWVPVKVPSVRTYKAAKRDTRWQIGWVRSLEWGFLVNNIFNFNLADNCSLDVMSVGYRGRPAWRESHSMHVKNLFRRVRKRVGTL